MLAELKPYPEYNDGNVTRLWDALPKHWTMSRLKHAAELLVSNVDKHSHEGEVPVRLCNYVDVYKNRRITDRVAFMRATATPDEVSRFRVRVGDVLITKDSEAWDDIGVPAIVEHQAPDLLCGYHLAILRPRGDCLVGGYLLYTLLAHTVAAQFHIAANGVTRYGLSHGAIKDILLPLPPPAEQEAIVRFLEAVDRKVNRFIRAKRRLIEVLTEQKQAIITQAVTKGLNPHATRKPSGIDWLGNVPEHWEVRRVRTLVSRIDQGVSPQAENRLADAEGTWGVLKAGCVNRGRFRATEHKRLPDGFIIDSSLRVVAGDVLVSRACGSPDLVGSVAQVTACPYQLILSDKTFRLVFKNPKHVAFLVYAMNSSVFRRQVRLAISGAEGLANNLPLSSLRDFVLPLPPREEAQAIAHALNEMLTENTTTIALAERQVDLIREYCTRLIADVVTGKLDVRGFVPTEPMPADETADEPIEEVGLEDEEAELVEEAVDAGD